MSKKILGTEPAFPTDRVNSQQGISKRFYAACAAMQGLLSASNILHIKQPHIELLTTMSFQIADELLKQEYNEQK